MPGKGAMIAIPLVLVLGLGGVGGAAYMGLVKIPGITPKSKMGKPNLYGEAGKKDVAQAKPKPKPAAPPAAPPPRKPKPTHTVEPEKGAEAVAELWNGISTEKLAPIVRDWEDPELATVLSKMDSKKAAALLSSLEPERASRLSQQISDQAAKVPIVEN